MNTPTVTDRQLKYDGYLKIEELTIRTAAGKEIKRELLRKQNAVAALVYNTLTNKYIFARQWRPGPENAMTEIPAGVLDKPGESPEQCIAREIEEEVGYSVDDITLITEGFVSPGSSSEAITIYFARVSRRTGSGGGALDENEEIEVVEMTREQMLATRFNGFKTIIAVQWAKYNLPEA